MMYIQTSMDLLCRVHTSRRYLRISERSTSPAGQNGDHHAAALPVACSLSPLTPILLFLSLRRFQHFSGRIPLNPHLTVIIR